MARGKQRSQQQQIDDRAVAVLQEKTPSGLVFRVQDKDFGVDCELEKFDDHPERAGYQLTTGLLFKGQVKGTTRASDLLLASGEELSKPFDIDDLFYWYEQLSIPVILFLVDVDTKEVYWTEFFGNEALRESYKRAKEADQDSVSVRFAKGNSFPATLDQLLATVERAAERIALRASPGFQAIEEHVRELEDPEEELRRLQQRLARSRYEVFARAATAGDVSGAAAAAQAIMASTECDAMTKVYAVRSMQAFVPDGPTGDHLVDRLLISMEFIEKAAPPVQSEPVGEIFAAAVEASIEVRLLAREIETLTSASRVPAERQENFFASMLLGMSEARVIALWRELESVTQGLASTVSAGTGNAIDVAHACALAAPLLCEAVQPLAWAARASNNVASLAQISSYSWSWLQLGLAYASTVNNESLGGSLVKAAAIYVAWPDGSELIRGRLVDVLRDENHAWLAGFDSVMRELEDAQTRAQRETASMRDVDMLREIGRRTLSAFGVNVDAALAGDDTGDPIGMGPIVRKAFTELDLTDYLGDCKHRCIFRSRFFGVSPVMDSVGLGFAASWKQVGCLQKKVLGSSVGFRLADTMAAFRTEHCDGCEHQEPHPAGWAFSYEYLAAMEGPVRGAFPKLFEEDPPEDS